MKKKRDLLLNRKIWSRRSSISPEFVDCFVRIYNGKTPVRCKITEGKVGHKFGEFAFTQKFSGNLQALLCRNLNVKSATLPNATSSRRIRLQDEIARRFHGLTSQLYFLYFTNGRVQQILFFFLLFFRLSFCLLALFQFFESAFPSALAMAPYETIPLEIPEGDVSQERIWDELARREQLSTIEKVIKAHERIAEHIRDLRKQEGMRLPGGFQAERLVEILEERYGGTAMIEIERDLRLRGLSSPFYRESKVIFDHFRREHITERLLRNEWQGRTRTQ
jgi:ribosomal protein S19